MRSSFLFDELVEDATLVSGYTEAWAATCDDEFGAVGFESECKSMRCHQMATSFMTVCDNSATKPPCRSSCQAVVNTKHPMNLSPSFVDQCNALTIKINISNPPNLWAIAHCKAIQLGDCSDFPADGAGCEAPVRYPAGSRCVIDSQCAGTGGCPHSGPGMPDGEGLGGHCCADGLRSCSGNGLCGTDGNCHCTFWRTGDDCATLYAPLWLAAVVCLGVCCICGGAAAAPL